jgi:hypothetical protein
MSKKDDLIGQLTHAEAVALLREARDVLEAADVALRRAEKSPSGSWCLIHRGVVEALLDLVGLLRFGTVASRKM